MQTEIKQRESELDTAVDEWTERFYSGTNQSLRDKTLEMIERDRHIDKLENK